MLYGCVGAYSKTGYYIEELGYNIHSIEELCYLLAQNATGLDESIMKPKLCQFIESELKLPALSRGLFTLMNQKGSLGAFVALILEACDYMSREDILAIEKLVKENLTLSPGGRRKVKGDYFAKNKKYFFALREYLEALSMVREEEDTQTEGKLLHNIGSVYARLFYYNEAQEYFWRAYELTGSDDSYMCYLSAIRLSGNKDDYVDRVIEERLDQSKVAKLEELIGELTSESSRNNESIIIQRAIESRNEGDSQEFARLVSRLIYDWKIEARNSMETD